MPRALSRDDDTLQNINSALERIEKLLIQMRDHTDKEQEGGEGDGKEKEKKRKRLLLVESSLFQ